MNGVVRLTVVRRLLYRLLLLLTVLVHCVPADAGIICDFELEKCDWRFESPGLDNADDPNVNFRIIGGNRDGQASEFHFAVAHMNR